MPRARFFLIWHANCYNAACVVVSLTWILNYSWLHFTCNYFYYDFITIGLQIDCGRFLSKVTSNRMVTFCLLHWCIDLHLMTYKKHECNSTTIFNIVGLPATHVVGRHRNNPSSLATIVSTSNKKIIIK